ncbi:MAG: hypothetical protein KY433_12525 [Actinobacteria bacterium]|nr:hypothetical protein [Actinomycetota bacterium]
MTARRRRAPVLSRPCPRRATTSAPRPGRLAPLLLSCVAIGFASIALHAAVAQAQPRCFGAAAMDSQRPCLNRTRTVTPKPDKAAGVPEARCAPIKRQRDPEVCTFGAPAARAVANVALIGDSHALHWRTPLDFVARAMRWRAFSITAPACFYSEAVFALPVGLVEACVPWYRSVGRWLAAHPEISTLVVSQNAPTPVRVEPGETVHRVKAAGFARSWQALPANVTRVIVIRDTPTLASTTLDCVRRAIKDRRRRPGTACSYSRRPALVADPAVSAVAALRSPRYRAVDMSDFFCGSRRCYPVIGGVLVHRDRDHINGIYAKTLGPYLLRAIRRLDRAPVAPRPA